MTMEERTVKLVIGYFSNVWDYTYTSETTVQDVKQFIKEKYGFTECHVVHEANILENEQLLAELNFDSQCYMYIHVCGSMSVSVSANDTPLNVKAAKARKYKAMIEQNPGYIDIVARKMARGDDNAIEKLLKNAERWMSAINIDVNLVLKKVMSQEVVKSPEFLRKFRGYPMNEMNIATGEHSIVIKPVETEEEDSSTTEEEETGSDVSEDVVSLLKTMHRLGLTGDDLRNITTLTRMGLDHSAAVAVYLDTGKDMNSIIRLLTESD